MAQNSDISEIRRDTVHQVFSGVNTDDYDRVMKALEGYGEAVREQEEKESHLKGWLLGLAIGAVIGSSVTGYIIWFSTHM